MKQTVKKKLKRQQTDAKFREIRINVSIGVISGKTHITAWMFLPFFFHPLIVLQPQTEMILPASPGWIQSPTMSAAGTSSALTETFWALPRLFALPEEGLLSTESMKPVSNSTVLPILRALYCCMCLRKWELFGDEYWGTIYTPLLQVLYTLGWGSSTWEPDIGLAICTCDK